jgi:hypothetical protein
MTPPGTGGIGASFGTSSLRPAIGELRDVGSVLKIVELKDKDSTFAEDKFMLECSRFNNSHFVHEQIAVGALCRRLVGRALRNAE